MKNINWKEVLQIQDENNILVDIRNKIAYQTSKVNEKVIHLDINEIQNFVDNIDKSKKYYIYCNRGISSIDVVDYLQKQNIDATNVIGGYQQLLEIKK